MNTDILLTIALQLGLMAGVLALLVMFLMIQFKLQAQGKWYIELNDNGTLDYHLVKESSQSRVTADGGEYVIPETPRMYMLWPMGLPKFMQVVVRHEKYVRGEELPLQLPTVTEFTNTAENTNRLVNAQIVKGLVEMLDDNSTLELVLKKYFPYMVFAALALAVGAGAAAYFGYQANQEIEEVMRALNSVLAEA